MVVYLIVINIISILATLYDKAAARMRSRRIPERILMLLAIIGGALGMFAVMLAIRHKTQHKLFMYGLPLIIVLHIILIILF